MDSPKGYKMHQLKDGMKYSAEIAGRPVNREFVKQGGNLYNNSYRPENESEAKTMKDTPNVASIVHEKESYIEHNGAFGVATSHNINRGTDPDGVSQWAKCTFIPRATVFYEAGNLDSGIKLENIRELPPGDSDATTIIWSSQLQLLQDYREHIGVINVPQTLSAIEALQRQMGRHRAAPAFTALTIPENTVVKEESTGKLFVREGDELLKVTAPVEEGAEVEKTKLALETLFNERIDLTAKYKTHAKLLV